MPESRGFNIEKGYFKERVSESEIRYDKLLINVFLLSKASLSWGSIEALFEDPLLDVKPNLLSRAVKPAPASKPMPADNKIFLVSLSMNFIPNKFVLCIL